MAFCIKCGQQLNENDAFCPYCGTKVERKESHHQTDFQNQARNTFNDIKNTTTDFVQNDHSGFMNKFIKQNNVVGLIACVIILIANFLPFISRSVLGYSQSASLMDYDDGIVFLALSIVTAVLIFIKKDTLALIAGIITSGFGVYEILQTNSAVEVYASYVTKEAGYYLLLIGAIILFASVIVKKFVIK